MSFKYLIKSKAIFFWKVFSVYYSFYKRYEHVYRNGEFKESKLTKKEKNDYIGYWKKISPIVSVKTVEITKSLTGSYNRYIVPEEIYVLYFEPYFNPRVESVFMENKNFYNKWFGSEYFPNDYFHKIDNVYYDGNLNKINHIEDYIDNCNIDFPIVVKPSVDSFGGRDIYFIKNKFDLKELYPKFKNLVVQQKIQQSVLMNKFNSDSINTIRVCLIKIDGEFQILNISLRMGKDGSLDNETAGGIVCNILDTGKLNSYAVDKYCRKFFTHPNTNVIFDNESLPFYSELIYSSKCIAEKIFNTNLISLDMCLDIQNKWRCIELNLFGQTIRFAQYAGNPFFGNYTDKIVQDFIKKKSGI